MSPDPVGRRSFLARIGAAFGLGGRPAASASPAPAPDRPHIEVERLTGVVVVTDRSAFVMAPAIRVRCGGQEKVIGIDCRYLDIPRETADEVARQSGMDVIR